MNSEAADLLARLPDLLPIPGRCSPPDRFLAKRLTWCEPIADRVAALGDAWGPILGAEPFMVVWFLLQGLAGAGRARACRCADVHGRALLAGEG